MRKRKLPCRLRKMQEIFLGCEEQPGGIEFFGKMDWLRIKYSDPEELDSVVPLRRGIIIGLFHSCRKEERNKLIETKKEIL